MEELAVNYGKYVIFSIDGQADPLKYTAFVAMIHGDPRMKGNMIPMVGSWQGVTERSFIMLGIDFATCVLPTWYENQEAVLWITECDKRYATLEFYDGRTEYAGRLRPVTAKEALTQEGWTYRPDQGQYYILG
jgi:hypothetical protein